MNHKVMAPFPPQALLEFAVLCLCADLLVPADGRRAVGAFLRQQLPCSLTPVFPLWPGVCKSGSKARFPLHMIYYRVDEPKHCSRAFCTVLRTMCGHAGWSSSVAFLGQQQRFDLQPEGRTGPCLATKGPA